MNTAPPPWLAELDLRFCSDVESARTLLANNRHRGPLRVQKALQPQSGGPCQVLLLHPPGGVAGGDQLRLRVQVEPGAKALLTTPGAGKWYRSAGEQARQSVHLRVATGATLEWLPQEAVVYDGARAEQHTDIDLEIGASAIGWDLVQLGRPVAGAPFASGEWHQRLQLRRAGQLAWFEQAEIIDADPLLHAPQGLAGYPVYGCLWASGPGLSADPERQRDLVREVLAEHAGALPFGVTWLAAPAEVLLVRGLAMQTEPLRRVFEQVWASLRPALIGVEACRPRIWAT